MDDFIDRWTPPLFFIACGVALVASFYNAVWLYFLAMGLLVVAAVALLYVMRCKWPETYREDGYPFDSYARPLEWMCPKCGDDALPCDSPVDGPLTVRCTACDYEWEVDDGGEVESTTD
jgi:rubredoxin